ncbi:sodium-translocating pyrophosphatase [Pelagicoccus mobilis]|uniref:Putative K(+)-stimulated pyrophosphate-energized sodium pump n=1 Tax=Pelagicoccus mobilis TaxID=415221 RepID=A0A934VQ59_9BACT|nr:sodium-translocating pyrophosphatase [Pelagicoccus mobilis]MBK1876233.1 sodium-translocating pyrophosphatase [Pelagicoccus mobilis]
MHSLSVYIAPLLGIAGLFFAFMIYRVITRQSGGDGQVAAIANQIHHGAMAFMRREIQLIAIFAVVVGVFLLFQDPWVSLAFFLGAIASSIAGLIGMYTATKANVRTTLAAHEKGPNQALTTAFLGGSIMGITVASMGLLGVGGLFVFFGKTEADTHVIHGFAMGASLVAIFFRVGGGIFTKAADVGADLVGKLESGIPEDDPRNPGVIADNVGDNVGDVAGMGSDLFESYCNSMIATMAIAASLSAEVGGESVLQALIHDSGTASSLIFLPLALASTGLICSLGGVAIVNRFASAAPEKALRIGTISAASAFVLASLLVIQLLGISTSVWFCVLTGTGGGVLIGAATEHYTGGKPMRDIAKSSETGVATVMISGLAVGMQSVVLPLLTVSGILIAASHFAGLYGVAVAAVGMLATIGITMSIDAYGPVADNAGGIAEMSGLGSKTREITDKLDEVGNTTAAIGKGFAIGAASLASLAIIAAYVKVVSANNPDFVLLLSDPLVLTGIFLGGLAPFLVSSITMNAVGESAAEMIEEIRRQFREIPGLLDGDADPDSERCIKIATNAALKRMFLPAAIAVLLPVIVGFVLGPVVLGGLLVGALLGCVLLALMMANSGGAWDNAKKYIEKGNFGGKNSDAHHACVVGDTVGDPLKDTSGPSMNILINVMAIVSLVIAPMLST